MGTYSFNLASYIGKNPAVEKANIAPANSTASGPVLKGNAEQYPGSFIEIRLTVSPAKEPGNALMSSVRAGSVYSQAATPKMATAAQRADDGEKAALVL